MADHFRELASALRACGDLCTQVGKVLLDIAHRIPTRDENRPQFGFQEAALRDELHIVEQHAFFVHVSRVRRHRAGRDATDIGVMASRRDVELRFASRIRGARLVGVVVAQEHRGDDGDVRQMRAAVVGRVEHEHVARLHRARTPVDDRADTLAHRPQMHRHMRRIGDQVALRVEQRARKVETLLDVHGVRRVRERHAHLLGDRHEQVVEHFQQHGVGIGADRMRALDRHDALEKEMIEGGQRRAPPVLDHRRRIGLADHRRPVDRVAGTQILAREHGGVMPCAVRVEPIGAQRRQRGARGERGPLVLHVLCLADRLDGNRLDNERLARHQKAVLLSVAALEFRGHECGVVLRRNRQCRVGAFVFQVQHTLAADARRRNSLVEDIASRTLFQRGERLVAVDQRRIRQPRFDGALP